MASSQAVVPRSALGPAFGAALGLALAVALAGGCASAPGAVADPRPSGDPRPSADEALLDEIEHRTFDYFWKTANPDNGLVPDRYPTPSFSSIAAVGFGLTAYAIGAERGYVTRAAARDRVRTTLAFFRDAPQGEAASGDTGYKAF
jgi:hypothetical protein